MGVDKKATDTEIKTKYKQLAKIYHPDKNNDSVEQKEEAEKKFKKVQKAYEILSDPKKRQQYDLTGSDDASEGHGFGGHNFSGFSSGFGGGHSMNIDISDLFRGMQG